MTQWARQSTCVAVGGRAILVEGAPGMGKSSLALALIDRGALLVGDDSVMLEEHQGVLYAMPHPNTRGLLEVRGVGLVRMAVEARVPVALLLHLDESAPRHVETTPTVDMGGVAIPCITLWPGASALALRAELALKNHGLSVA